MKIMKTITHLFNFHWNCETEEIFSHIIFQHPLASDFNLWVDIEDWNRHVIDQHFSFLNRTVSGAKIIASIHWTTIERELYATNNNSNNLACEAVCSRSCSHCQFTSCRLTLMDDAWETGASIKCDALNFGFGATILNGNLIKSLCFWSSIRNSKECNRSNNKFHHAGGVF